MSEKGKSPVETIKKLWGFEQVMVNETEYCFKLLVLQPGFSSSLHYHKRKKETFVVKKGWCFLDVLKSNGETKRLTMECGDSFTLEPGKPHRFFLPDSPEAKACVIYEISTHHSDLDVERIVESHKLDGIPERIGI